MTEDHRQDAIRRYVAELVALESGIERFLGQQVLAVRSQSEVSAAVQRFHGVAKSQHDVLKSYLETMNKNKGNLRETIVTRLFEGLGGEGEPGDEMISRLVRADYAAFTFGVMSYAILYEVALRLYDPTLREIAPRHLKTYAEAAQTFNQLIASVVARELQQDGLDCHCICPMCGIGACGCVAFCTETLNMTWRETATAGEATTGFPLQRPRAGSQLALAGVKVGDRLLAVDDQLVRSTRDVQAAIRRHQIGGEVRLSVQRGSEPAKEIRVNHVSDYSRA
jgi:hypothetical protein